MGAHEKGWETVRILAFAFIMILGLASCVLADIGDGEDSCELTGECVEGHAIIRYSVNGPEVYDPNDPSQKMQEHTNVFDFIAANSGLPITGYRPIHVLRSGYSESAVSHGLLNELLIMFSNSVTVSDALLSLQGLSNSTYTIQQASPNLIYSTEEVSPSPVCCPGSVAGGDPDDPNDAHFLEQWGLKSIRAPEAWSMEGDEETVVAIIDTGIDYNHEDIGAKMWVNPGEDINHNDVFDASDVNGIDDDTPPNGKIDDLIGWSFVGSGDKDPMDTSASGHGTHMAGIVAAVTNNGIGIASTAPNAKIMALRVGATGGADIFQDAIEAAIEYAVQKGADVINMSFSHTFEPNMSAILNELALAHGSNIVLVGAAGNADGSFPAGHPYLTRNRYPAVWEGCYMQNDREYCTNVIAVMASDPDNARGNWGSLQSAYGNWIDIAAPGKDIQSTKPSNSYDRGSGSSQATAFVSGVAALMKSRNPLLTHDDVESLIMETTIIQANDGDPNVADPGIVDAYNAVVSSIEVSNSPEWIGVDTNGDGLPDNGPVTLHSNKTADFTVLFDDEDGDSLTVQPSNVGVGLDGYLFFSDPPGWESYFMWTADEQDFCGSALPSHYQVSFTADDGTGNSVTSNPPVQILFPHNCAPEFAIPPFNGAITPPPNPDGSFTLHLGMPLQFTLTATDRDSVDTLGYYPEPVFVGDPPVFVGYMLPAGAQLNAGSGLFTWTPFYLPEPCNSESCTSALGVYVSDRGPINGQESPPELLTDQFATTVTVHNLKPSFSGSPTSGSAQTCQSFNLALSVADDDGDSFSVNSQNLPSGASFNSNTLTFTWPSPTSGNTSITFWARDYFCIGGNAPGSCVDDPETDEVPYVESLGNPAYHTVSISVSTCGGGLKSPTSSKTVVVMA